MGHYYNTLRVLLSLVTSYLSFTSYVFPNQQLIVWHLNPVRRHLYMFRLISNIARNISSNPAKNPSIRTAFVWTYYKELVYYVFIHFKWIQLVSRTEKYFDQALDYM